MARSILDEGVVLCHWSEVGVTAPAVSEPRLDEEEDEEDEEVTAAADGKTLGLSNVSVRRDAPSESWYPSRL